MFVSLGPAVGVGCRTSHGEEENHGSSSHHVRKLKSIAHGTRFCRLGLQTYVADLDARGYTVIPPEIATPNGLAERMLEAVLDIAERRNGERPDLETGSTHAHLGIETTSTRRAKGRPKGRLPTRPGR